MLLNYFKIAIRSLMKHKGFSVINLSGLTVALTCCLLMVLYIRHELSYDRFQPKGDRIARVIMEYSFGGTEPNKGNYTSTYVFPSFKRNFPEVEDGVRMTWGGGLVKVGEKLFEERRFIYADSTFFNVFPAFTLRKGNPQQVLMRPNQVVLSAATAKRYFGEENPIGKIIQVGSNQTNYEVTGVADESPSNSQIRFDLLASFSSLGTSNEPTYWNANYSTYLLLKQPSDIAKLQAKIGPFMKKEMADPNTFLTYWLEPYTSIHLHSPFDSFEPNTNIAYIYIASGIAVLILLIACFTYVNMSTARSLERAREVGIRKVAGASRGQVFWQFIGESIVLCVLALILSVVLVKFLLPPFNHLVGRELGIRELMQPGIIAAVVIMIASIALLAGSYPALVLSGFQPVKVLKGSFRNTSKGHFLRQSLTVFQFTISAFLLIATFVIQQQFRYIQNKSLGFDREHSLVINIDEKIAQKLETMKTEFKKDPHVRAVSRVNQLPVNIVGGFSMRRADMASGTELSVYANPVDEEFLDAINLPLVAGEGIRKADMKETQHENSDSNYYHFLLNESAARQLGWTPEKAVGQKMFLGDGRPGEVSGVVKDFHFASLHTPIKSLVLFPIDWGGNNLIVKTDGANLSQTIAYLEKTWKTLVPHRPFSYRFMDEEFNRLYKTEKQTAQVISLFSGVAILLACVGLLGLSAFTVQQRIKEIGVRKVLGASTSGLVWMLSRSFLRLVLVACAIAIPFSWLFARRWLQDFSYRISLTATVFVIAGILLLVVALLVISIQTFRAALANPVKSLRTE
ncbi:ABC transporter permease [Flavihumibacter petaseus]|uniref:Putative ABC transporter permease protein n=1 Tax=Flavihumibacter petaseus NBRC 106054 TaxID=1220578 RepID=A0A0E9N2C7_9BACT|nr:ABC transporter permease [Flavihumibacter petaseus]GAO44157.1 putative ABC transporter permease protein [Flavihumibacter petaseus NBRC 106054]